MTASSIGASNGPTYARYLESDEVIESYAFDPAKAARLFLPFQSDKPNGFGLGLSLTRKIMLLHGGDVELTSNGGGEAGVTAIVTLPVAA